MAVKLGELLVKEKIITPSQLEEALKAQVVFGGRLGTNLVELGYLEEEALAYFLSENLGVPYVHPQTLSSLDPKVIKLIPRKVAEKYRVIPVDVKNKRIRLAMSDPTDIQALDELAFVTGYIVKPMIAPELHILHALEKYYKIPRDIRYITISRKIGKPKDAPVEDGSETLLPPKKEAKAFPSAEDILELIEEEPVEELEELEEVEELEEEEEEEEEEAKEVEGEEKVKEVKEVGKVKEVKEEAAEPHEELYSFSEACRDLEVVENRDEIAEVFLRYCLQFLERVALFIVRKYMVEGWNGRGKNVNQRMIRRIKIPRAVPSIFKDIIDSKKYYLGELPDQPVNEKFVNFMGRVNPGTVLFIPINLKDKPVCILYGDNPKEGSLPPDRLGEFFLLANRAAKSFEQLILKFKKSKA